MKFQKGLHEQKGVSTSELQDYISSLRYDTGYTTKQQTFFYVHPSGTYTPLPIGGAMVMQQAFGGVAIKALTLSENAATVIEPNRIGELTVDEIKDAYGIDMSNRKLGNPSKYGGHVGESPLIDGQTNYKKFTISGAYKYFDSLPTEPTLDMSDITPVELKTPHDDLYKAQQSTLAKLQNQDDGFHLLSGEVGVGKTHIAAAYINDTIKSNPQAKVIVIEPIDGVVSKFKSLLDNQENVMITDDASKLTKDNWDLVVFDEFHRMDGNGYVSSYPRSNYDMPKNILAMTGTVSNTYPEQVWSVTKNYVSRYFAENDHVNLQEGLAMGPYVERTINTSTGDSKKLMMPEMSTIRLEPEYLLDHILADNTVQLLRRDIEELNVEETMPVNKFASGFDLTPQDKLFSNLLASRAKMLNMTTENQLDILDDAFNTNKKEFIVQPTRDSLYNDEKRYQLVDPDTVMDNHDLLYLGKHDQPFQDKKIGFIADLAKDKQEKVLVYMLSNDYAKRVQEDLNKTGITTEFVDTHIDGAVDKINDSDANVVLFDINPITEGIDLHANTVVWYSTPRSAGLDEQACGRITRLSSEQADKNFYYLYHKTTIQESITKNIIRTNDINNRALQRNDQNIQDVSELDGNLQL